MADFATRSFVDETASISGSAPRTVRLDAERAAAANVAMGNNVDEKFAPTFSGAEGSKQNFRSRFFGHHKARENAK